MSINALAASRSYRIRWLSASVLCALVLGVALAEMVTTGRLIAHERLTGMLEPEQVLQTIRGTGPGLADCSHDDVRVDTREQLEQAAHDGGLARVPGVGARRAFAIRGALTDRLGYRRFQRLPRTSGPPIALVLDVGWEYREKAATNRLRRIAPKHFNPAAEARLPVLHSSRGDWQFTVVLSNTQRARELKNTND